MRTILAEDDGVQGYDDTSYGRGFAEVYDDWYHGISDIAATTDRLRRLAAGGPVLELGVGTGRLAVPLAAAGVDVHGVDSSPEMLGRLAANDPSGTVRATIGDMVDGLPDGPFTLVFAAYNTFFNLLSAQRQQACFHSVAARLRPGGAFVIEAFVPESAPPPSSSVTVRAVEVDRVVLSVSTTDLERQLAEGQYIDITEAGGVRLRPWCIRWATPAQLDAMAVAAGLQLVERFGGFGGGEMTAESVRHVSVYRTKASPVHASPAICS